MIDSKTRTILLPKGITSYDIVQLPDYRDITSTLKYLLTGKDVYEMKLIEQDPKSIILESSTTDPGYVVESGELIVSSKFDIVYLLISCLNTQKSFISIENIIDNFEWLGLLPESLVSRKLELICETVTEGQEKFYKINSDKVNSLIQQRVDKLAKVLADSKLVTQVKLSLYVDTEGEIPTGMLEEEIKYIAYEMVLGYMSITLDLYDFTELFSYKKDISSKLILREMQNQPQEKKPTKPVKATKKKATKVVAKGKGALDMFFTKK